jgi:predicted  nucleic acid-binding Zn-ribbon protein
MVDYLKNFTKKEENKKMDKTLFRISDSEKADILFDLINPNFNEEGGWVLNGFITEVYDDYALCVNKDGYFRTYYTKDGDNITIGDTVSVKIVDVTATEYSALEAMKSIGGTYEAAQTAYTEATEKVTSLETAAAEFETEKNALETKISELEGAMTEFETTKTNLETQISEKDTMITDFNSKIEAYESEKVELNNKISDITNENNMLVEFKKNIENEQKEAILTKYEEYLTEEAIAEFKKSINDLSVEDFKKEVCTSAVENDPAIFANRNNEPDKFFKGDSASGKAAAGGVLALLEKRKNGGNK